MHPGDAREGADQLTQAALREFPGLSAADIARLGADAFERADTVTKRELEAFETLQRG